MGYDDIQIYSNCIKTLEAQEVLMQIQSTVYPKLTREEQRRQHRRLHKIAYPHIYTDNTMSADDVAKKLGVLNGQ